MDDDSEDEEISKQTKYLSVRFKTGLSSDQTAEANLSYLSRGLMWAPSYMLRQNKSNKTLTLQGNASLLCDIPFFRGKSIQSVSLAAGQPKIECQNISDPLASGVTAADFIRQLDGESFDDYRLKETTNLRRAPAMSYGATISSDEMSDCCLLLSDCESAEGISAGKSMDDLYFYRLKNVPLHYNRPMSLPFIEECASEPYQDVYFFDLNNRGSVNDSNVVEATHAITFKNASGQPFTTGPVSVLMAEEGKDKDDKQRNSIEKNFLVQSSMKYTGP